MRMRRRSHWSRLPDFLAGLMTAAIVVPALAVTTVGPLLVQNLLSEIASAGSSAQATARTNLGIGGSVPPWMPIAGGTFTGPVIWNTSATATFMASLTGSPASANVTFSPTGTGRVIIAPATAGTIDNMVLGGVTPLAGSFTTITASSTISGAGVTSLFASPPAIGGSAAAAGTFTALSATTSLTANVSGNISLNATGTVALSPTGALTVNPTAASTINNASVGATTSAAGKFTTLQATTSLTLPGGTVATPGGNASFGSASSTVGTGTYYAGHSLIGVQTFCLSGCTTTSTGTYTADAGTNQVIIEVQAAGGGSGGCGSTDAAHACVGGSGAGGSYGRALFTSSFSGITFTIGAAGAAGTNAPGAGGVGGTTSAGTLISCPGGTGGLAGNQTVNVAFAPVTLGVAAPSACTFTGGTTLASIQGQGTGTSFTGALAAGGQSPAAGGSSALGLGAPSFQTTASATLTGIAGTGYGWGAAGSLNDASQASATTGLAGGPSRIVVLEFN